MCYIYIYAIVCYVYMYIIDQKLSVSQVDEIISPTYIVYCFSPTFSFTSQGPFPSPPRRLLSLSVCTRKKARNVACMLDVMGIIIVYVYLSCTYRSCWSGHKKNFGNRFFGQR